MPKTLGISAVKGGFGGLRAGRTVWLRANLLYQLCVISVTNAALKTHQKSRVEWVKVVCGSGKCNIDDNKYILGVFVDK